jgi:nitrogen-specific signal transduction histidine kinase
MIVTVARDISDRRQLEQQRLRAQRMESLGTLAGGVAHDMNNMLTPVILMLDELQDAGHLPSPNLLASVRTSVKRGAGMLRQLLTFGSGIAGERAPVDLNRQIEELGRIIASTFPKSITFETKVARKLPAVLGDATQLHQVLLNLCVNARDALPGGGFIKVTAVHVVLDSANAATWPEAKPGSYVRVEVSDNGSGIPPEIIERVFDPFFTTKSADKGTGLGLSTTLGIVRGHGGTIRVKSQPDIGTCFGLLLPVSSSQPLIETTDRQENIKGRNRTVLVIEDEETIRDVLKRSLERMSFKVIVATSGDEGLALCDEHQPGLSLVITDLNMPGMNGLTVVRHLRASSPALPVMVMSGRVDDSILATLKELKIAGLIDKPFGYAQVEAAIKRVLG